MAALLENTLQVILGILGLSFLVFIHELGHFIVAKRNGVRVKVFSIGFGKKLLRWQRGETEYCISLIPFGGYVAMAGENPDEESSEGPQPSDFNVQRIRVRAAIAFGGPAVNILFAFLALFGLYMWGVPEPAMDRLVVGYVEKESAGEKAGIQSGDTIYSVAGRATEGWDKFREAMGISLGAPVEVGLGRATGRKTVTVIPDEFLDMGVGTSGVHPRHRIVIPIPPVEGSPAMEAGIRKGDSILAVEGHIVTWYEDVIKIVNGSAGKPIIFTLLRGIDTLQVSVRPAFNEKEKRYMIGVQMGLFMLNETVTVRRGPVDAFVKAGATSIDMATSIFRYLYRITQGQVKVKALSGPVGIVPIIGMTWLESFNRLVSIMALISLNLGVMNLLPLAITDGGILMFLVIEWLRGRPLSRSKQAMIQQVATLLFISIFIYLSFMDLGRVGMFFK